MACRGGTEIMHEGLLRHLEAEVGKINLGLNVMPLTDEPDHRPMVVWIHHDIDQPSIQWLRDGDLKRLPAKFVFVSAFQANEYHKEFGIEAERIAVIENATEIGEDSAQWPVSGRPVCGYVSTPYRGLALLLGAWEILEPDAELHVFSSMKIYGLDEEEPRFQPLYEWAKSLPGVHYHSSVPNEQIKAFWPTCHFLPYPNVFREMGSVAVIEAMSAGVRVVCPRYGCLTDMVRGYGATYEWSPDLKEHVRRFARVMKIELETLQRKPVAALAQQDYCRARYSWAVQAPKWRNLIASLAG